MIWFKSVWLGSQPIGWFPLRFSNSKLRSKWSFIKMDLQRKNALKPTLLKSIWIGFEPYQFNFQSSGWTQLDSCTSLISSAIERPTKHVVRVLLTKVHILQLIFWCRMINIGITQELWTDHFIPKTQKGRWNHRTWTWWIFKNYLSQIHGEKWTTKLSSWSNTHLYNYHQTTTSHALKIVFLLHGNGKVAMMLTTTTTVTQTRMMMKKKTTTF